MATNYKLTLTMKKYVIVIEIAKIYNKHKNTIYRWIERNILNVHQDFCGIKRSILLIEYLSIPTFYRRKYENNSS